MANHEHAKLVVGLVTDTLTEILLVMDFCWVPSTLLYVCISIDGCLCLSLSKGKVDWPLEAAGFHRPT